MAAYHKYEFKLHPLAWTVKDNVKITAHGYDMYGNPKSEDWYVTLDEADVIETVYPGGPW